MEKFVTLDVGSTWSKIFLVSLDSRNILNVDKSIRLPTSVGDPAITIRALLSQIPNGNESKTFVSNLEGVEKIAKESGADFVKEVEVKEVTVDYLKEAESDCIILDAGATNLAVDFSVEDVGKFLSFPMNELALENFFGNRRFRPHILPKNTKELEIEEAFCRTYLAPRFSARSKNQKVIVAASGGVLSGAPSLARVALLISDILEAGDVAQVFFDREFFLPSFGALLFRYKQLQAANLGSWFEPLGALASLGGSSQVGLDWGYSEVQTVELGAEEISLVPAPADQKINLSFGLPATNKEKKNFLVGGGSLGILLDARSKPLTLTFGQEASRNKIVTWQKEIEKIAIL